MNKLIIAIAWGALLCASKLAAAGNVVEAASPSLADIRAAIAKAADGDTVNVPAGTASWSEMLVPAKSITLRGQTTTTNAGKRDATADDKTIIIDELPRGRTNQGFVSINRPFRLTGFTFKSGSSAKGQRGDGTIRLGGGTVAAPNYSVRIDHCHFDHILAKDVGVKGVCYGLADHNIHDAGPREESYHVTTPGADMGNSVWADYPWFGTNKFFFIEDCTIRGMGGQTTGSGTIDSTLGGRFVIRNCYLKGTHIGGHGTEGGPPRGMRATERYGNFIDVDRRQGGTIRSGTHLEHDEQFLGAEPANVARFQVFRCIGASGNNGGTWGAADGTSPWDMNDTEGNYTWVDGHAPHLFDSGTATQTRPEGTLIDDTKAWPVNKWMGFGVHHARINKGSHIEGNAATAAQFVGYGASDRGPLVAFNAGDRYEIHRLIAALDQSGRGKGDLIKIVRRKPVNAKTGTAQWPHQQLEPCISWNNVHVPSGRVLGFNTQLPNIIENRDYYNLGRGFGSTPQVVKDAYTAAVNGVQYAGPYTYPHPLQGGGAVPTPTPAQSGDSRADRHSQLDGPATPTPTPAPPATATPAAHPDRDAGGEPGRHLGVPPERPGDGWRPGRDPVRRFRELHLTQPADAEVERRLPDVLFCGWVYMDADEVNKLHQPALVGERQGVGVVGRAVHPDDPAAGDWSDFDDSHRLTFCVSPKLRYMFI